MPTTKSAIWIFSITWFAPVDSQPVAHKAFERVAKRFCYQWELAPTTKAPHLQGAINTRTRYYVGKNGKCRPLARLLSSLGMKGVTVSVCSDDGKEQLKAYAMKEETRLAGPWADRPLYRGQDLCCMKLPFPWQNTIMAKIAEKPDDRKIIWISNKSGNVGKSKLLKYLCYKKLAKRLPLGNATQLKTNCIVQGPARCYCVDIPRTIGTTEKMSDLISALEEIKNGWITSAMYGKYQELMMEPPHVLVFANFSPEIDCLTADKLVQYDVNPLLKTLVRFVRNN